MSNRRKLAFVFLFLILNQGLEYVVSRNYFYVETGDRYFNFVPLPLAWLIGGSILVALWFLTNKKPPLAWWWLFAGFSSNVITFVIRGSFIDYLPTGISYFNLSDLVILGGIGLFIFWFRRPV